jgi:DNA-nicking Smr family endonuclease
MKSGGGIKRAPRIRVPSREELALWRHATADVRPREEKAPAPDDPTLTPPIPASAGLASTAPASVPDRASPPAPNEQRKSSPPALAPLAPLERRLKRRLTSGKAQVDDVLDLHGLTQEQAHRRLNHFLWRSAENGAKLVLIITGKGAAIAADESHAAERGVLRRNTPHWLRSPELRAIVLSVEEAARPHGGAGALYVRLRRGLRG